MEESDIIEECFLSLLKTSLDVSSLFVQWSSLPGGELGAGPRAAVERTCFLVTESLHGLTECVLCAVIPCGLWFKLVHSTLSACWRRRASWSLMSSGVHARGLPNNLDLFAWAYRLLHTTVPASLSTIIALICVQSWCSYYTAPSHNGWKIRKSCNEIFMSLHFSGNVPPRLPSHSIFRFNNTISLLICRSRIG